MRPDQVLKVLAHLQAAGVRTWIGGGWGIDALIGEQTRPHDDLDLAIDTRDQAHAIQTLQHAGFQMVEDHRPTRFVMRTPPAPKSTCTRSTSPTPAPASSSSRVASRSCTQPTPSPPAGSPASSCPACRPSSSSASTSATHRRPRTTMTSGYCATGSA
jgi:hypothetical protein